MTYIYDVLLNFTDEKRIIEFFEWEKDDILEHVKKIPIIRVSSKTIKELISNEIEVEKDFLERIKNITTLYKKTKNLQYASLITDLNRVVGIEFNKEGRIISRSSLLLDEEEEIIEECLDIKEEKLEYKIMETSQKNKFLTRSETKKRRYLLKEIDNLYKDKNIDKLTYLYDELYNKDNTTFQEKYLKIKLDLEENYTKKHNDLYDIVRLTYIKK